MKYLKIKDNIDLKELEKFGFKINKTKEKYIEVTTNQNRTIVIISTREVLICKYGMYARIPSAIVGLIKADMVEVVENEKN